MKTGLLLVDIQNDYFPGGKMELDRTEQAGLNAGKLLAAFREKGRPVFHVRHLSVGARIDNLIQTTEPKVTHQAHLLCQTIVIGNNCTTFEGIEEFCSMKTQNFTLSKASNRSTFVGGTKSMSRIKH